MKVNFLRFDNQSQCSAISYQNVHSSRLNHNICDHKHGLNKVSWAKLMQSSIISHDENSINTETVGWLVGWHGGVNFQNETRIRKQVGPRE